MQKISAYLTELENRQLLGAMIFILSVIFIVLCFQILPSALYQQHTPPDFVNAYEPTALNIVDGNGIRGSDGDVMVRYPPGFPIVIATIYRLAEITGLPHRALLDSAIIMFSAITCVLVFHLGKLVTENNLKGLIAAGLWLSYPFFLRLTNQPFTEPLFILLLLLSLIILFNMIRHGQKIILLFILCGLLIGFMMLVRPIAIALSPVFGFIVLVVARHIQLWRRVTGIILMLLAVAVVVYPWQSYASANTDSTVLLSSGGFPTVLHGYTFAVSPTRAYYPGIIDPGDEVLALQQLIRDQYDDGTLTGLGDTLQFLWSQLLETPIATIHFLVFKALRSWYATSSTELDNFVLLIQLPYLLVSLIAVLRIWITQSWQDRWILLSMLLIVGYFWGVTTLTFSILRYMMPVMPLLFIMIAMAFPLPESVSDDTQDSRITD